MAERIWRAVSIDDLARLHDQTRGALRGRIQRRAGKATDPRRLEFDGHRFQKRLGRWYSFVCEPWHSQGRLHSWLSLEEAADRSRIKPPSLRRQLQRHATVERGLQAARWRGLLGCKFGDTWRVCFLDDEASHG